uniref:J domain-containing protein n=1 Tax=Chromera velia CCMP2878 TaxID=1169474 RepID=A0A0G4HXV7_9ALVE|eukprot:Cvel_9360.t1-p1 / transcript=Cvel_9360.t1 / gene=Cvel_9360 / organism=Chromera_velia_CCMP2878 / gene_product=Chaperone protein DnaJ, putative / transcript_product=Chaperone protein DnaJ, putative / location=Cvel_scaffold537:47606-54193(+) / protein_length=422 / sequence_SO=supercontig / SO=protein_coding / is_pseudo=false
MTRQLIAHSLVAGCGVRACMTFEQKFPRLAKVVALLLVLSLAYREYVSRPPNFFEILEVDYEAGPTELKTAYRAAAKKAHPDKNLDGDDAVDDFLEIKKAHDVLSHEEARSTYARFGDFGEERVAKLTPTDVVCHTLVFWGMAAVIGGLLTLPRPYREARQYLLVYILVCACGEMHLRFTEDPVLEFVPQFGSLLAFEKVETLRRLFPAVLGACALLSYIVYGCHMETLTYLLRNVQESNNLIIRKATEAQEKLAGGSAAGALGGPSGRPSSGKERGGGGGGRVMIRSAAQEIQMVASGQKQLGEEHSKEPVALFTELLLSLDSDQRKVLKERFISRIDQIHKNRLEAASRGAQGDSSSQPAGSGVGEGATASSSSVGGGGVAAAASNNAAAKAFVTEKEGEKEEEEEEADEEEETEEEDEE